MAAQFFTIGGYLAMAGWVALILSLFFGRIRRWTWPVTGIAIPGLLAIAYIMLLMSSAGPGPEGGFGSIGAVRALFAEDSLLAAGWIHYLAFDLLVGTWIVRSGLASGVHPLFLLPCLPLTFLFGPAGFLLALIVLTSFGNRSWARQAPD